MAPLKRKYRTIYIVTAALMVALIGGYALAATTLTTGPNQGSNVTTSPTSGFTYGSVTSEQLVIITTAMAGVGMAGSQPTGAVGLMGTPSGLTSCTTAPCTAQNFRPLTPATETVGDYAEQILLSISQPVTATGSQGFDFSITVTTSTTTVVFQGFLATGTTTVTGGETVPVFLFADLGSTTAPIINGVSIVFNLCSSMSSCP